MKKMIRRGCFETNSSSAHVIVVTKKDEHINPDTIIWNRNAENMSNDTVYLNVNGTWSLSDIDDGFGRWPFQMLTTFEEKFKYAMCEFLGYLYGDDPEFDRIYNEFEAIAKKYIPGCKGLHVHTREMDLYLDKDGNEILHKDLKYDGYDEKNHREIYYYLDSDGNKQPAVFDEDNYYEYPNIGMIDHQSAGLLKNFLKDKKISLEEFLTNKKYVVCIDGDEYMAWDAIKKTGFINLDFISEEYNTSGEDVEFKEWLEWEKEHEENDSV